MDHTENNIALFDRYADTYQQRFMDVSRYAPWINRTLALIPEPGARVLDAGCGPGNLSRYLLDHRPDLAVMGIDLSPAMVALARQHNPEARFEVMDCRNLETLQTFDAVFAGFVVPYLSLEQLKTFFRQVESRLRPGGLLYLSAIEGDYETSGYAQSSKEGDDDKAFQYYYPLPLLENLLGQTGFLVLETGNLFNQANGSSKVTELIVLAQKLRDEN